MLLSDKRIKEARKALRLSQKDMAAALGVSQGHLSDLEAGRKQPSEMLLRAICNRWAINYEWLSGGPGEMTIGEAQASCAEAKDKDISDLMERITYVYRFGDEDQKSLLYGQVSRIYNKLLEEREKGRGGEANEGSDREPERFPGAEGSEKPEEGPPGKVQKPA